MNYKLLAAVLACLTPVLATAAEPAKVSVTGHIDTTVGYAKDSKYYRHEFSTSPPFMASPNAYHKSAIVNDTKITVNADGKYNKDIGYGAVIKLHADASKASNSEVNVGDKTMFYVQHEKVGRFEAGNYFGVAAAFEGSVPLIETGTAGVDGLWNQWPSQNTKKIAVRPNVAGYQFIMNPNLPSYYSGEYYSDAPKVTFYTKPVKNLTVGISYTPDMDAAGTVANIAKKNAGPYDSRAGNPATFKKVFTAGGSYMHEISKDFNITGALTGEVGKAKLAELRDLKAYEASLAIQHKDTKLTASYGDAFKTWTLKDHLPGAKQKAKYWTVGLGQQMDKFGVAVGYMNSQKAGGLELLMVTPYRACPGFKDQVTDYRSNKLEVVTFDVDYQLVQGLMPYAGAAVFRFKESQGNKNNGYVLMGGTKLSF